MYEQLTPLWRFLLVRAHGVQKGLNKAKWKKNSRRKNKQQMAEITNHDDYFITSCFPQQHLSEAFTDFMTTQCAMHNSSHRTKSTKSSLLWYGQQTSPSKSRTCWFINYTLSSPCPANMSVFINEPLQNPKKAWSVTELHKLCVRNLPFQILWLAGSTNYSSSLHRLIKPQSWLTFLYVDH